MLERSKTPPVQFPSSDPLKIKAIGAFARVFHRGEGISPEVLGGLSGAFPKMRWKEAWKVCRDYAAGQLNESGKQLEKIVSSWLVLGSAQFEMVFFFTRIARKAIEAGKAAVRTLARRIKKHWLGGGQPVSLRSIISAIHRNFGPVDPVVPVALA